MASTVLSLRALALAGLGLAVVSALPARAQEAKKPNILVIWGDDIGWYNVSAYNLGVMGYRTPNIDRIAKEGALFTDWYGQQSCTAGRVGLRDRAVADPHRPDQGRPARGARGPEQVGPHHRRAAEAARLRHRPVRQEPPRRPQRAHPDGARLRRVLRQPLPPQRRGGAGERGLPAGPGVPRPLRPARRPALHTPRRRRRRPPTRASAPGGSRSARTPARSRASAWRRRTASS